jgi:proteasome lid subunit RPN8/RPN11
MITKVQIQYETATSIIYGAKAAYPHEIIFLLRGKIKDTTLFVTSIIIPPFASGNGNSARFPLGTLPIDFSIAGTVHSHPSGVLEPSMVDLNSFYGKIMAIVAYPYDLRSNLAFFDAQGEKIFHEIVE